MQKSGIRCLLLDDGLREVEKVANGLSWQKRFTNGSVYRIVRIEAVAEVGVLIHPESVDGTTKGYPKHTPQQIQNHLTLSPPRFTQRCGVLHPSRLLWDSILVCYRTSLNVGVNSDDLSGVERSIVTTVSSWKNAGGSDVLRLTAKALNDFVVCVTLSIAA